MHCNILQWIIYAVLLPLYGFGATATIMAMTAIPTTKPTTKILHSKQRGMIRDINVNVVPYEKGEKILQLLVDWKDNLPADTSYNVIVTAVNATLCSDPPCSVYGIKKPQQQEQLAIPANPMTNVEPAECNYMFGCNYTLTVETSNAVIYEKQLVEIPYCVMDECSCQHEHYMPKIKMDASIPQNDTLIFNWSIPYDDISSRMWTSVWQDNQINKIHLKISEQTNPSLTWGGNQIPINDEFYDIASVTHKKSQDILRGSMTIKLNQQMASKAMLNVHAHVIDELGCQGPASFINLQVPEIGVLLSDEYRLRAALIIITVLFVLVVVGVLVFCVWRRHTLKLKSELKKDEHYMSAFATVVEMEDNIIYVDKYIEASQAKGLADIFEVPHHSVQIGPEIGEGAFGRVYKAIATNLRGIRGSTLVAVKQLKKNPTPDEVEEFLSEIKMLKGVGTHHNIVCFLGCCTIRPPYLMIMEYVGRGDLLSYLRTVRNANSNLNAKHANCNGKLSSNSKAAATNQPTVKYIELKRSTQSVDSEAEVERKQPKPSFAETTYTIVNDEDYNDTFEYILDHKELHNFALQIANGMRFLEEQEITHRDLAARNVLIDDRKILKISDFGLSRHGIYTNTKTRKLPLRWLSIEAIRDNVYSNKSDVWAYGVVLWEIGTLGASPYPTISNHELIPYLLAGKRLEKPEICTEQVYALMLQCWDEDPNNRPTFEELYKALSPKTAYVDINSLSDDYVFPPIKDKDSSIY